MKKYDFFTIFQEKPNGALSTRVPIIISHFKFEPNTTAKPGETIGGINFNLYKGQAILAEKKNDALIIRGVYDN